MNKNRIADYISIPLWIFSEKKKKPEKRNRVKLYCFRIIAVTFAVVFFSCTDPYFKNDYEDNSPTSGKLKILYDEGLRLHIKNHIHTFESQYPKASIEAFSVSENSAVEALFNDSCKIIMISRFLSKEEQQAFESKNIFPRFSAVAKSGVALITNTDTPVDSLTLGQVKDLLTKTFVREDSIGNQNQISVLFDKNNSAIVHYLLDSVLKGEKFSSHCATLDSTLASINYVAKNKNTIAFIDYAWLSDKDDSLYKANRHKIKFIAVAKDAQYEYPGQSSFKLGTYPFTRTVYIIRKSGEFSLGKGFESFVAGPRGQMTFLKQGLLPTRQQERIININFEPLKTE